jgi:hypothetical protein
MARRPIAMSCHAATVTARCYQDRATLNLPHPPSCRGYGWYDRRIRAASVFRLLIIPLPCHNDKCDAFQHGMHGLSAAQAPACLPSQHSPRHCQSGEKML